MIRAVALFLLVPAALPMTLRAQTVPGRFASSGSEFTVGYSYVFRDYRHTQLNPTSGGMNGWNAEFAKPRALGGHFGYVVDGSGYYSFGGFFSPQIYFTTIGPQYTIATGRATISVRALVGAMFASGDVIAQTSSNVRPIFGAGAAWDYPAGHRVAWRISVDYVYGGFNSNDGDQISQIVRSNGRTSVGPIWTF